MPLPHMTIDPARPGVILFDGDPLTGMIAGISAKEIAQACNAHDDLVNALRDLLLCPEIADTAAEDKDPETHAAERRARAAIAKATA